MLGPVEQDEQRYSIHRAKESINKLDSHSGSSDASSPQSHGSKAKAIRNDGMGTLSQQFLQEGDPVEQRK